jgi:hypothetical protein
MICIFKGAITTTTTTSTIHTDKKMKSLSPISLLIVECIRANMLSLEFCLVSKESWKHIFS